IRYALTAIKGVGRPVIESIVQERIARGRFTNLKDFITRVAELDVTAEGNTLSYIYTFKETYPEENLEAFRADLKESMEGEIADDMSQRVPLMEKEFGVKGLKIYMEYRYGDGSVIYGDNIN
ncbi:MAG: DUF4854 domain-containing protein, partial [Mogibacterium sp.]|nr:DUF4854 domain-containing protein [Mogibacterium sp.]